jgi:cytidylate kinase
MISIAIDGPSGAGKSSMAKSLAKELGYTYVDTGAMYRSIGLFALQNGRDPADAAAVTALLPKIRLDIRVQNGTQHILLNGRDVSEEIRQEKVGMAASAVGAQPDVRAFLLETQRELARRQNVLMDGRDIGTVVLPQATVKIFLTASPEARAHRRLAELAEKGQPADYETVLADIRRRDDQDTHRAIAPLRQAADAVLVDTSELGIEQSLELLKKMILEHLPA